MYVLLTKCSSSGDRMNSDNVHTMKNRRSKNYGNKDPPLALFLIQNVNAILGGRMKLVQKRSQPFKTENCKKHTSKKEGSSEECCVARWNEDCSEN